MNVDRNIKRLLSTLGKCIHRSVLFKSFYYEITYPDGYVLTVRLSDHFSDKPTLSCLHIELLDEEKSEKAFIRFLNNKGVAQRHINKLTGISLRQIKNYLKLDDNG